MVKRVADRGVESKSEKLRGKTIALGVCGGIGSVEVVKIIRELRRHGARLRVFCTPSVSDFIAPLSLEWASGEKVITQMGAEVDHLEAFDLVLLAPCTLNTLAKAASGIADNAVTMLLAGQFGRRGAVAIVPTMNAQLQNHPLYSEHVSRLEKWGAVLFDRPAEEDRLKMPSPEDLATFVIERLR